MRLPLQFAIVTISYMSINNLKKIPIILSMCFFQKSFRTKVYCTENLFVNWILTPFKIIGNFAHTFIRESGRMVCFLATAFFWVLFPPYLLRRIVKQINFIGVKTTLVIILTGSFTGMVLALQTYYALVKFGAETSLGPVVALSLIRELGTSSFRLDGYRARWFCINGGNWYYEDFRANRRP